MNIFAIADLHLSFMVDKPMHVFGTNWTDHAKRIETAWKSKVTNEDIVLVPGDISWALRLNEALLDLKWLDELPGHKVCIRGNHDYWWDRPTKLNKAYEHITFLQNDAYMMNDLAICGTRGWEIIPADGADMIEHQRMIKRELMRLELSLKAAVNKGANRIWVMIHYPPMLDQELFLPFIALFKAYGVEKVIYGHLHDEISWQNACRGKKDGITYYLTSADYLDFKPLLIEQID